MKRQARRYFLPLIFHNAKGYDVHPLLKEITKSHYACKFEGIPNSSEKFLTLAIIQPPMYKAIKILDSLQFMNRSLASLVDNQKKGMANMAEGFPQFCNFFKNMGYSYEQTKLLLQKNKFLYEWLDSFGKLLLPIQALPLKD